MALSLKRRLRDNLHGSIDLTILEDKVIGHPYFQRLRRIKQTALLHLVFPGATHTRFEHSLGVMHQAGLAFQKIKTNQNLLKYKYDSHPAQAHFETVQHEQLEEVLGLSFPLMSTIFESEYIQQALRLAALLHDVGHPPFSHSGERFLPKISQIIKANPLDTYLKDYLLNLSTQNDRSNHEIFTLLMVDHMLKEIYAQNKDIDCVVAPQDVLAILKPEIAPCPDSPLITLQAQQLCHDLVSGEIDVDRMDYLLRDSRECGVVYGIFDVERIMDSLCLYYNTREKKLHLALLQSGLAAFEDYLRARQSMYLQLYFHKTSIGCEAMLKNIIKKLGSWTLPAEIKAYVQEDEYSLYHTLMQAKEEHIKDPETKQTFERHLRNLFYDRKLWKRVYEIQAYNLEDHNQIEKAKKVLAKFNLPFEHVSSINILTRALSKNLYSEKQTSLRLIQKDAQQLLRVVPLRQGVSPRFEANTVKIDRLYMDSDGLGEDTILRIKKAFYEDLLHS